jgi:C4-dicarboxylate-specific signal transduction histidine kinase
LRILNTQPIRRQVLAATVAVLVPVALAATWSARRTRIERDVEVVEQAGSVAATAGAYLNQYLNGLDSLASALTRHPGVIALDPAQCQPLFAGVLRGQPLILNILVTDAAGRIRGSALDARSGDEVSPLAMGYVMAVVKSGKPTVSELMIGRVSGKPTVVLAYPVRNTADAIVGVLAFGLNVASLQTLFNDVPLPQGSVVTLFDASGRVLARSREAERYIGKVAEANPSAPRDVPRAQTLRGLDGVERFYGNAALDRGPWLLSVGIPTSVAADRVASIYRRNWYTAYFAFAAVILLTLWLSESLTRGLNRVRSAVQRIADGDLSPPAPTRLPNRELEQLYAAFTTMAASLRDTHGALDHRIEQERKMREALQSLQRQVVRQERLAAVGVLVSGVAHELNNPLQAILGTAELLERQSNLSEEELEEIGFIKTQSGRAREIIRNLSRFSSQQGGPPTPVDLRDVVAEVVQLRKRGLESASIALELDLPETRHVQVNFTEIEQVTLNFVINAQQAIEASGRTKGRIRIRVFDTGRRVCLEVADDGPGVAADDEPKLFQPFFTTKPVGQGTGLGLSVSYGIIESYSGTIGHRPNEWGGATFYFELPVTDGAKSPAAAGRTKSV